MYSTSTEGASCQREFNPIARRIYGIGKQSCVGVAPTAGQGGLQRQLLAMASATPLFNHLNFVYRDRPPGHVGVAMQDEAVITISGVKLSDAESMTIRVAVDTLANVLAEGLEEKESQELSAIYLESLVRIQGLLESRESRKQ
jgi:hypothetical protein